MAPSKQREKVDAKAGDWVETRSISGGSPRRGQISAVMGAGAHCRFRVRWDDGHESIVYPSDGVSVIAGRTRQ